VKHSYLGAALVAGFLLSACAYNVDTVAIGSFDVVSSFDEKLKGKYLFYAEGGELRQEVKPSDFNCAAHRYPLDLSTSFIGSARATFANLVDELEVVDSYVPRDDLAGRGARGIIVVRGEDVNARMRVVPGFWTAGMEARVALTASISVDGRNGRLLGTTVEGDGETQTDSGLACEGGSKALAGASEDAMKETVRKLGEALANSERVRSGG